MTNAESRISTMPTKKKDIRRTSAITLGVGTIGGVAAIALSSTLVGVAAVVATGAWLGRLWTIERYRQD